LETTECLLLDLADALPRDAEALGNLLEGLGFLVVEPKAELENERMLASELPPLLHPHMADVWRAEITELRDALTEDRCDPEARQPCATWWRRYGSRRAMACWLLM